MHLASGRTICQVLLIILTANKNGCFTLLDFVYNEMFDIFAYVNKLYLLSLVMKGSFGAIVRSRVGVIEIAFCKAR